MNAKKLSLLALSALTAITLLLSGCGQQAQKEIKLGATSGPHAEVAEAVAKEAANQGLKVTVVEFSDYVTPDQALADGDIDLNSYQHEPFLKNLPHSTTPNFPLLAQRFSCAWVSTVIKSTT